MGRYAPLWSRAGFNTLPAKSSTAQRVVRVYARAKTTQ
jgi:hypothetical protein